MKTLFSEERLAAPVLFLAITAALALAGLAIHALADQRPEEGEDVMRQTTIITATDVHYLAPSLTDHGPLFETTIANADGKVMEYIEELTDAFLEEVISKAPDALILSGDLAFNGERESHEALASKLGAVKDAGIPVLVIPGNHDLYRANAARFIGDGFVRVPSVTAEEFAGIYARCGYDDALSRDDASLSYICALSPRLRVLMLDVNTEEEPGRVKEETLAWAEEQLAMARAAGARVIAVSHQNLYRHNSLIYENYVIGNSGALLALYERYGGTVNLSGHLHCQHIAGIGESVCDIATGSLAVSPDHYGILSLGSGGISYEAVPVDVSGWAARHGSEEADLLDFAAYARGFFEDSGRTQTESMPEEAREFFVRLNTAYFSGRMDLIDPDDPGFDLWTTGDGFHGLYVQSMRLDAGLDSTRLTLGEGPSDLHPAREDG